MMGNLILSNFISSDLSKLVATQISAPFIRLLFAFCVIPLVDSGERILNVLILSEVIVALLSLGRSFLISSGHNHVIVHKGLDQILIIGLFFVLFSLFATEQQHALLVPVIATTSAFLINNLYSAYFLKSKKYLQVIVISILCYSTLLVSVTSGIYFAVTLVAVWLVSELFIPAFERIAKNRLIPSLATSISLFTQRLDLQLAALLLTGSLLEEIFQAATLLLPLSVLVRVVSNTALVRGRTLGGDNFIINIAFLIIPIIYTFLMMVVAELYQVSLVKDYWWVFLAVIVLSLMTIRIREKISVFANTGNFLPNFYLSFAGLFPLLILGAFLYLGFKPSMEIFLVSSYVIPRILIFVTGFWLVKVRSYED